MSKVCKKFKLAEDGFCENYLGSKEKLENCRCNCKKIKAKSNSDKKKKDKLEKQIIGIELPYDPSKKIDKKCIG